MTLHIRAERQIWSDRIEIHVASDSPGGFAILRPPTAEIVPAGAHLGEPMLSLALVDAQRLMDELWHCGLRPSEGSGSAGSLAATERHLKDMRTIAMGLLRESGVEVT